MSVEELPPITETRQSLRGKYWVTLPGAPPEVMEASEHHPLVTTLLYQRGLHQPEAMEAFLTDSYPKGLHSPDLMKGLPEASKRLAEAIREGEPIVVFGDFDVDGVTAVALVTQAIRAMGGNLRPYIPHRINEGYGLNCDAVRRLAEEGTRILLTVDCGISNVREVALARELGMDAIVTDHHSPPAILPDAFAVINPKQPGCNYPFKQLAGVGLAFKLVQALVREGIELPLRARDLLDLVALGTVADVAPLIDENRVLVKAGLEALRTTTRPGLVALMQVSRVEPQAINAQTIGFTLGPRLNAAGRLDDAQISYNLLLSEDPFDAAQLAQGLEMLNSNRQTMTKQVQESARTAAEASGRDSDSIVVLDSEEYPAGIVGLVASRLVDTWSRPVILIHRDGEDARGSARSVPGYSIIQALTRCGHLFTRYGGHAAAAGFSILPERIPDLRKELLDIAEETLDDRLLLPRLYVHAETPLNAISPELYRDIQQLAPFGAHNEEPILLSRRVMLRSLRTMGSTNDHLRFDVVAGGGGLIEAVAFGFGKNARELASSPWVDLIYTLEVSTFRGSRRLQLRVIDIRPADL